jgi:glucose-1-phosphatase
MKNNIKAIIFDMGGVILRTNDESPRRELAEYLGISLEQLKDEVFSSDMAIKSEEGLIDKYDLWKFILKSHGHQDLDKAQEYDEKFWSGDRLDQELLEYIKVLKKQFALGMISNAFKGAREWIESHYHFTQLFDYSVFSYEIKIRKPDPRIYQLVCRKLKVNPQQAIFVDDILENVEGARKAGLIGIQYFGPNQLKHEIKQILE